MKKILILILIAGMTFFFACEPDQPAAPQLDVTINELATSKMVAVGNSLTAGFQSSGMLEDFQVNSYPYLVAQQMGKTEFEHVLHMQQSQREIEMLQNRLRREPY